MAPAQPPSEPRADAPTGLIPRHLLLVVLLVAVVGLVVVNLRLSARNTALELRIESLETTRPVRPPPPESPEDGPPEGATGHTPRRGPPSERPGSPPSGARPSDGGSSSSSSSGSGAASSGGSSGGEAELIIHGEQGGVIERHPSKAKARAERQRIEQRFDDRLQNAGYDEETEIALEDEIFRSFDAHDQVRTQLDQGGMNDQQLQEFMEDDLATLVENVTDILGKEEGVEFIEEVLGVPQEEIQRAAMPRTAEEVEP